MTKLAKRLTAVLTTAAVLAASLVTTVSATNHTCSASFSYYGVLCDGYGYNNAYSTTQNVHRVELTTSGYRRYGTQPTINFDFIHVDWEIQYTSSGTAFQTGIEENGEDATNTITGTDSFALTIAGTTWGHHSIGNGSEILFSENTVSYIR